MAKLKLTALTLRNFKAFRGEHELRLDQAPGLYLVMGKNPRFNRLGANGVGKSTLLADGPLWILFGKTIRDKNPGAAIVPWNGDKDVYGKLSLKRGKRAFEIERTRTPNHLILIENGERREVSQAEVIKLIGMSEEMFRRTLILGQWGTLFLDLRPDAQAQMFSEALQLEVYLFATDVAKKERDKYDAIIADLEKEHGELKSAIRELTRSKKDARKRADGFAAKLGVELDRMGKAGEDLAADLYAHQEYLLDQPKRPKVSTKMAENLEAQAALRESFGRLTSDIDKRKDQVDDWEQECRTLKAAEQGKCPECGQKLTWDHYQKVMRKLSGKIEEAQAANKADDAALKKLSSRVEDLKEEQKTIDEKRRRKDKGYEDALEEYHKSMRAVTFAEAALNDHLRAIARLEDSDNEAAVELRRLIKRRKKKRARVVELEEEELVIARRKKDRAEYWVKAYKEIRLSIIDQALVELEIASARHAGLLGLEDWGIRFETERETSTGSTSYKFTVMLYPPDQKKPIKWESYSGGESQRLQLAVTFALSEVLLSRAGIDPGMEVLDEPTKGLSPEGISELLEHLRERALELGRTIYLVDHHALDRGAFDGVLVVTQKVKGGSSFEWQ